MSDSLYSVPEHAQWRGPSTSDNYNERIENLYKDLTVLVNRIGLSEENIYLFARRLLKEHMALTHTMLDLELRLELIERGDTSLTFGTYESVDNTRFNSTDFAVASDAALTWDSQHSVFTLPQNASASFSKLRMVNTDGTSVIPSSFEALAQGVEGTADSLSSILDTSDIYNAVLQDLGLVWERNVLVDHPNANGATVVLYVRFPTDLVVNDNTNTLIIHPFPSTGCDVVEIAYTTKADVSMNTSDSYLPLNSQALYSGNEFAVGWVPPGGWIGDTDIGAGPRVYRFDPIAMTGLRITLHQDRYYAENAKYVYSYGMSKIDARYEKYADEGKTIIRFDAPQNTTISNVENVLPDIWNVMEAEVPNVFDYRVIYETAYNSGVYTTTPVALSNRVWVEVTLRKTLNGGTPSLSGLNLEYS